MKFRLILWASILIWGVFPYPLDYFWTEQQEGDLVITGQACGCPCANSRILTGKAPIPDSMLHANPEMYRKQLSLVGNTPFDPFIFDLAVARIIIEGEVVGLDTIRCSRSGCELAAEFRVDHWETLDYIPQRESWSDWQKQLYEFIFYLGIVVILMRLFPFFVKLFSRLDLGNQLSQKN